MRATLTFNLPEDADDFRLAGKATELAAALGDILQALRNRMKYEEPCREGVKELDAIWELVWDLLHDRGLDPHEL